MAKIVGTKRMDGDLENEGFEMGQEVWLPNFKQTGIVTGMDQVTIEAHPGGFIVSGIYPYIRITLENGTKTREWSKSISHHIPKGRGPK